jgi:hypothetical protein
MRSDHVVERCFQGHGVGDRLSVSDDLVDVNDLVESTSHSLVACVFPFQFFGAGVIHVRHRAVSLADPRRRQWPDLQPAHLGDVEGGQLGSHLCREASVRPQDQVAVALSNVCRTQNSFASGSAMTTQLTSP